MIDVKISHYFHQVHDLKEALTFFRDVMGFSLVYSHLTDVTEEQLTGEDIDKLQWLEFNAGTITLIVQNVPGIKPYETGIGFRVNNCDEAYVYFKNQGVGIVSPIKGIVDKYRFFEIKDPTGSIFNIFGN